MPRRSDSENTPSLCEKRGWDRGYFIGGGVTLLINAGITALIILQEIYGLGRSFTDEKFLILVDGFSISGVLMCLFYLLVFISDEGAFDIISYSVQLVFHMTFHRNIRETKLPKSYAEYREMKRAKPRLNLSFILFSGLIFLIIGLILLIPYHSV